MGQNEIPANIPTASAVVVTNRCLGAPEGRANAGLQDDKFGLCADPRRSYFFSSGSGGRCPSLHTGSDSFPLSDITTLQFR